MVVVVGCAEYPGQILFRAGAGGLHQEKHGCGGASCGAAHHIHLGPRGA